MALPRFGVNARKGRLGGIVKERTLFRFQLRGLLGEGYGGFFRAAFTLPEQ